MRARAARGGKASDREVQLRGARAGTPRVEVAITPQLPRRPPICRPSCNRGFAQLPSWHSPMKHVLAALWLASCASAPTPGSPASRTPQEPRVHHVGVIREVMREGRMEARATLADHVAPGTYGVGALTALGGEILIEDGTAWVAVDGPVAAAAPADATATMLTTARVPDWQATRLDTGNDLLGLENLLAQAAAGRVARGEAMPFLLEGRGSVRMHVVRGACPHGEVPPGHEPSRWSADDVALRCVGFFVEGQEGVMTHMGTSLHLHAFATDERGRVVMGHVDDLTVQPGARLRLPLAMAARGEPGR